jgi:hypothetical protein
MELPKLNNIKFNTGLGLKAIIDKKQILIALLNLELITGQRPFITRAKKSIDKFKLRINMPVGCQVTLNKHNKYIFLDKFINIIISSMDSSHEFFLSPIFLKNTLNNINKISCYDNNNNKYFYYFFTNFNKFKACSIEIRNKF